MMATVEYTKDQLDAIDIAQEGLNHSDLTVIGGFAGTGKTTIVKEIVNRIPNLAVVTFTGKASSVLRSKGVKSNTIHSTIYAYDDDYEEFYLKESVDFNGFVIDEASMVGKELYYDLCSFGLPILAVGDPGQLEPVGDSTLSLMDSPDITLTKIHRQAARSPIIDLATKIRKGYEPQLQEKKGCAVRRFAQFERDGIDWADAVLCGYNRTRTYLNKEYRKHFNLTDVLTPEDKLICTQNDRKLGVYNGMTLQVTEIRRKSSKRVWDCAVLFDDGQTRNCSIWLGGLMNSDSLRDWQTIKTMQGTAIIVDYAGAITVHKAQGSEWDKVAVINQKAKWDQRRWLYTGVTRASKELVVYI